MRTIAVLFIWTLVVLFPNLSALLVSVQRAWSPPVDPQAVEHLVATLPDDPRAIEAAVNSTIVPYAVPWQTYNVPWYFPTPREILERGEGDCQARAVVLASILRAKGIPATFVGSLDHLWVDYPGKHSTNDENAAVAIVEQQIDGSYQFRWPALVNWRASWDVERAYFWDAMPTSRLTLLLLGWSVIILGMRQASGKQRTQAVPHVQRPACI